MNCKFMTPEKVTILEARFIVVHLEKHYFYMYCCSLI